ncbi:hypothetical protein OG786_29045 [Streptomyces sp. NBC_00101]|uniref:hypothetical protein n=1 Tax=Streptomyces sp. NBC_00101 TaxID=2975651 RepID=UPI00324867AA
MSITGIARLDTPASTLRQQVAAQTLADARKTTHSPSDAIAYDLGQYLVTHPDAPVSTDADYPGWVPGSPS